MHAAMPLIYDLMDLLVNVLTTALATYYYMVALTNVFFSITIDDEGNGNPLEYSCLENPRDRGAWWAAVYGVAQSRTQLMRLSSSSIIDDESQYQFEFTW